MEMKDIYCVLNAKKINMVYRKIVYAGEGERALRKRIEEITQRKEKIFHFTIETFEDDKIS